jgi:ABC-2 type transport system permease protein
MNLNHLKTLITKEWLELKSNKQALLPVAILPLIFTVVMPVSMILAQSKMENTSQIEQLLKNFPIQFLPGNLTISQQALYFQLIYLFSPFFLIIPVMIASIIAANSFAGEKERRTIEGLLYTPISDQELVLGKIAASFIPAVIVSILSFVLYCLIVDIMSFPIFHYLILPNLTWLILIFWLSPAISFASFAVVVAISQRAKTVWSAQQSSALMVVPIVALVASQATGVMILSSLSVFWIGLVIYIIDYFAYRWISSHLNRERLVNSYT